MQLRNQTALTNGSSQAASAVALSLFFVLAMVTGHALAEKEDSSQFAEQMEAAGQRLEIMAGDVANFTAERKAEAAAAMKESLDAVDRNIDKMEEWTLRQWGELSESARAARSKSMRELRSARNEMAEWMGSVRYGSADTWEEIKDGIGAANQRLKDAYDDAVESMSESDRSS